MVVYYQIAGQKIGSHWLSIATLGTTFLGAWAMSGGKKDAPKSPPTNAKSSDEEKFIQDFINSAEQGSSKVSAKDREGH